MEKIIYFSVLSLSCVQLVWFIIRKPENYSKSSLGIIIILVITNFIAIAGVYGEPKGYDNFTLNYLYMTLSVPIMAVLIIKLLVGTAHSSTYLTCNSCGESLYVGHNEESISLCRECAEKA
jgi:hypothetical protein